MQRRASFDISINTLILLAIMVVAAVAIISLVNWGPSQIKTAASSWIGSQIPGFGG